MPIKLDQIKTLLVVAQLKSFAAAASKLNTTQPGVSSRIKSLERELGVKLFTRTTRSVELTPEGRQCIAYADKIIKYTSQLEEKFKGPEKLNGTFRIGVSDCIADTWLITLITHLDDEYPDLQIEIHMGQFFSFIEKLKKGDLDLALSGGSRDILNASNVSASYLGSMRYDWMCSGDCVNQYPKVLEPEDLQHERILIYHRETLLFQMAEAWFSSGGAKCERWNSFDTTHAIASQTIAGLGVGLLPRSLYEDLVADNKLKILPSQKSIPALHSYAMYIAPSSSAAHQAIVEQAVSLCNFEKIDGIL